MTLRSVIAIFDVGKTNKKLFLFDESYKKVYEETDQIEETIDEDGDDCEDLAKLTRWIITGFEKIMKMPDVNVKAINFSAYGASFVHIMRKGKNPLPLYNYLKPYPKSLLDEFYEAYGGKLKIEEETASAVSGNLNSGLQLYRLKKQKPRDFAGILKSLHLPQYLSFLVTGKKYSNITSIGCHTSLWNFETWSYHPWVYQEGIDKKLAPIRSSEEGIELIFEKRKLVAGVGLHDSSAALIPYLLSFNEPFVLISTGTWCVSLNPFNDSKLTWEDLKNDSLCYIHYKGLPVKANRLFTGYEHARQVQQLAEFFSKAPDYYTQVNYSATILKQIKERPSIFDKGNESALLRLELFGSYEEAYHQLMVNIVEKQVVSTKLVLEGTDVKRIFVDGTFSNNPIFMNLIGQAFPAMEIFASSMAQTAAIGAALAIHHQWNSQPLPTDMIELKMYTAIRETESS